jgi:hypothetical protein
MHFPAWRRPGSTRRMVSVTFASSLSVNRKWVPRVDPDAAADPSLTANTDGRALNPVISGAVLSELVEPGWPPPCATISSDSRRESVAWLENNQVNAAPSAHRR